MQPREEFNPYFQSPRQPSRYQPQEPPPQPQPQTSQHRRLRFDEPPPQRQPGQHPRQEQASQRDQQGLASTPTPQRQQGRLRQQERPPQNAQQGPASASTPFPQTPVPQQRQHDHHQGPAPAPGPAWQHGPRQHQEPTTSTPPMPLPLHDPHHENLQGQRAGGARPAGLTVIRSRPTNPLAWLLGVLCALIWLVIFAGGLLILVIYLIFRPRSPRFDIPAVSLNAVYLDMGVLLNADVTFLANFTNPNQKVKVEFTYIVFGLYYHNTLIASSYSVPFSATRRESKLQNVHLVSSEVRLPDDDIERLRKQLEQNMVTFEVRGLFRTKSKFGGLFQYPYWLHARCGINITGPPSGVLVSRRCRTKR